MSKQKSILKDLVAINKIKNNNSQIEYKDYTKDEIVNKYQDPKFGLMGKTEFAKKLNADPDIVNDVVHELDSYTLNAKSHKTFPTMKIITKDIDYQWQADLVDMQQYASDNDGYKYLLTCIDLASRYAWVKAIKDKTAISVKNAFKSIIDEGRKPKLLQTDSGTEFLSSQFQSFLRDNDIKHFVPPTNSNAAMIERFHLTLKGRMSKLWTHNGTFRYVDDLQDLVFNYNHTYHSVIKMKPVNVGEDNVVKAVYNSNSKNFLINSSPPKFKVGDHVRINSTRHTFLRHTDDRYTYEIFKVNKVNITTPYTYYLIDLKGEEITGRFYEPEMIKVSGDIDNREWKIKDIIDLKGRGKNAKVLVRWLGFGDKFDSWEDISIIDGHDKSKYSYWKK